MRICEHAYGCTEPATKRVTTWRRQQLLCDMHADAVVALALTQGAPFPEIEELETSSTACSSSALRDGPSVHDAVPSRSAQVEKPT